MSDRDGDRAAGDVEIAAETTRGVGTRAATGVAPVGGIGPGTAPAAEPPVISFEHVSYSYGDHVVVDDVSFEIGRGEIVALLGPNGCGKTTIMRLMNGLAFPDAGRISFEGEPVTREALADQLTAKRFHQRLGFVFQNADDQLFCASVEEEVAFGPAQMGLTDEEVNRRVHDVLALFGITDLAPLAPYRLSGGQKKRTALAAIVSMNPDALVLDEPTNGLDEDSADAVTAFLLAYARAGKTVVVSTHHRDFVEALGARPVRIGKDHKLVPASVPEDAVGDVAIR